MRQIQRAQQNFRTTQMMVISIIRKLLGTTDVCGSMSHVGRAKKAKCSKKAQASEQVTLTPMPINIEFPNTSVYPVQEEITILVAAVSPPSAMAQAPPMPADTIMPIAASLPAPVVGTIAPELETAIISAAVLPVLGVVLAPQTLGESAILVAPTPVAIYIRISTLFPLTPEELEDDGAQGMLPHHSKRKYYMQ